MPVKPLDIFASFNKARFTQVGSADCANWYGEMIEQGKSKVAYYPTMCRKHVTMNGDTKLVFQDEPRALFNSKNFMYVVVDSRLIQIDRFYNEIVLTHDLSLEFDIWFKYLAVGEKFYCMFSDGKNIYVVTEDPYLPVTFTKCTDGNVPSNPTYITVFGNRFVVSSRNSPIWGLSQINLSGTSATWFTDPTTSAALQVSASGPVGQLATLHNQLYIFTDETVDIWADIPTQIPLAGGSTLSFPFKKNTSANWDVGIADDKSLDTDFGMMVWLGKNVNGLAEFVMSSGGQPVPISNQAVNVLLETSNQTNGLSPFLKYDATGFLYQWENSVFYRVSVGKNLDIGEVDIADTENALEFNFNRKKWNRVIELNGGRNKIKEHVYFNNKHFVTVEDSTALYEMRGDFYYNEIQDTNDFEVFEKVPMRYELVTGQIFQEDYSEFDTKYVEIDFVFGDQSYFKNNTPFNNAVFAVDEDGKYIITEDSESGSETFLITEDSNTPTVDDNHYYQLFTPHIELYWSDDGGMTFHSADVREFSPLGQYQWRMRWYQLGASRNRVYKLVAVAACPIVILGAVHLINRISGGAN